MAQESIPLVRTASGEYTDKAGLVKAVEGLRISLCAAGIGLGYAKYYQVFALLVVLSLAGVTGLESLLLGDASAASKGWPTGSPYQKQSACNNLALAAGAILFAALRANQALAATVVVTLIFIFLSGINHLLTTARAAGFQIHTFRFLGAVVLAAAAAPVVHMWGVL